MSEYDAAAGRLQASVRSSEEERAMLVDYDDNRVRMSIVHAREDIVMLVSHLSSINKQLCGIRARLSWTLIGVFAIAYKLWNPN